MPAPNPRAPVPPAGEPLLTPRSYAVYIRVPLMWWSETETVNEIADTLHETKASVRLRLAHLITSGLVERRKRNTIDRAVEVRRVGK